MQGLPFILGVVFVVLKLVDVIDWSWWLVTMPFWIGIVIMLLFVGGIMGAEAISDKQSSEK